MVLLIVAWLIFFVVLYFVVKMAVKDGIDSSNTHKIIEKYIESKTPIKPIKQIIVPTSNETFEIIYDFFKKKNLPLQEVVHTPFGNILFVKSNEDNLFVQVQGERVILIEMEDVKLEWKEWVESRQ